MATALLRREAGAPPSRDGAACRRRRVTWPKSTHILRNESAGYLCNVLIKQNYPIFESAIFVAGRPETRVTFLRGRSLANLVGRRFAFVGYETPGGIIASEITELAE